MKNKLKAAFVGGGTLLAAAAVTAAALSQPTDPASADPPGPQLR